MSRRELGSAVSADEAGSAGAGGRSNCFPDLTAYYQRRYRDERRRLDQIAAELGSAQSAVRGDLRRLGLGPDRTRSHGARWQAPR